MRLHQAVLLAAVVLYAPLARAKLPPDERVVFLSDQLGRATDPRSRALAAMMLGATGDPRSLAVLCKALDDMSWIVRSCAARALAQIHEPSAADCLQAHAKDVDEQVRHAVTRALASIAEERARPPFLYIALGEPVDKAPRPSPELTAVAEEYLRLKLSALGAVLAPAGETDEQARAVVASRKLKGFYLVVTVEVRPGGALGLKLRGHTYPERAPLGEISVSATGARPEVLLRALTPKAVDQAAADFNWRP